MSLKTLIRRSDILMDCMYKSEPARRPALLSAMTSIIKDAQGYPFHSFGVVEDSELKGATLHHRSDHCILLSVAEDNRVQLYWACDSDIEFVPASFLSSLESIGFAVHSEYIDYWLYDLKPVNTIPIKGHADLRRATAADFRRSNPGTRASLTIWI